MSDSPPATNPGTISPKLTTKTQPAAKPRLLPPYAVVLENDNQHSFGFVIETLQRVFGYGRFKAFRLTLRAHVSGRAIVWTGPMETCEFKRDRVRSMGPDLYARRPVEFPLGCFIEPLPG